MKNKLLYFLILLALQSSLLLAQTTRTVGPVGNYTTLKAAFDDINAGNLTGAIILQITGSTTESATATLNASGSGSAKYSSIIIYPTGSGYSVSGNLTAPLIDLNGASNVTIDGRVNESGTLIDLTMTNIDAGISSSTIKLVNDASSNLVEYCNICGSSTSLSSGIVFFSNANVTGNNNNTFYYNNITNAGGNRPANAIFSEESKGDGNSGNTISNNNIFNFFLSGSTSYGIYISDNNTSWTISGNNFYENSTFIPSSPDPYFVIFISNSGDSYNISNNFIGGNSAGCNGTWIKTNANDNAFIGIYLDAGTSNSCNIQGNVISGFSWSNNSTSSWTAIEVDGGTINIGTVSGNIIGASSGTGSISITGGGLDVYVLGIYITSASVDCENNIIGAITSSNSLSNASNIIGIWKDNSGNVTTIINNTIGSTITSNSINATSSSASDQQSVIGIKNDNKDNVTINNNIICGLTNATTNTLGAIIGLSFTGYKSSNSANANFIANFSATGGSSTATIYGIYLSPGTISTTFNNTNTYSNNIVSLTGNTATTIYGIYEFYQTTPNTKYFDKLYFNTIYISGTLSSGTLKSYCLYSNGSAAKRDFRDNIFANTRSTSGGSNLHYSAYIFKPSGSGSITIDGNDYFASGTGTILGNYGGSNITTLFAWQTATGQDANSLATDPTFVNPGTNNSVDYRVTVPLPGVSGTGITTDFGGNSRASTPTIGAWEFPVNKWVGSVSTDFGTSSNWSVGFVPSSNSNIIFDDSPQNNCLLDKDRTATNITINQATYRLVTNGHKLTVTGNFNLTNGATIDASSSFSTVAFQGTSAQSIPSGTFLDNNVYNLLVNNTKNVAIYGTLNLAGSITSSLGSFDAFTNTPTIIFNGGSAQSIPSGIFTSNKIYNLTLSNSTNVVVGNGTLIILNLLTATSGSLDAVTNAPTIVFGGSSAQSIPSGVFTTNQVYNLTVSNSSNVAVSGTLNIMNLLSATSGALDASTNSPTIGFAGTYAQSIPANVFTGNQVYNLNINNSKNVTANGTLKILNQLTASSGSLDAVTASPTIVFAGSSAQSIPSGAFYLNKVYNLTISNPANVAVYGTLNLMNLLTVTSGSLDASTNSPTIVFAGSTAQSIPSGAFYLNGVYNLTVNNASNVTLNGTLNILNLFTATNGALDASTNSPTVIFGGTSSQSVTANSFLNNTIYNLTIDNSSGVTLNTNFTVNNILTINSGKIFTIAAPNLLTVSGTITNNAGNSGLVLKSTGDGTDSKLINNTASVPGTVELYLNGGAGTYGPRFHYIVPPVASINIGNSVSDVDTDLRVTNFAGDLMDYSEPAAGLNKDLGWEYYDGYTGGGVYTSNPFTSLVNSQGYNIRFTADDKPIFTGTLNGPAQTFSNLSFTSSSTDLGWNLIGNPYPCNYNLSGVTALTQAGSNVDHTVYFNHEGGYAFWNVELGEGSTGFSSIVAPMQGFFVHVTATGTSVSLPTSLKTSSSAAPARSKGDTKGSSTVSALKLVLDNGTVPDETIVCLVDKATFSFDGDFDAYKFFNNSTTAPSIYTELNSVQYALNSVPPPGTSNDTIPLSVVLQNAGTYRINVTEFENLDAIPVTLKHGNVLTPLSQDASYTFTLGAGTYKDFSIIFGNVLTGINDVKYETIKIWYYDNYIYINCPDNGTGGNSDLKIYDIQGRLVYDNPQVFLVPKQTIQVPVNIKRGIYITRLLSNNQPYVSKIVVL